MTAAFCWGFLVGMVVGGNVAILFYVTVTTAARRYKDADDE